MTLKFLESVKNNNNNLETHISSLCKSITGTHGGAVTEFHPAWDVLLPKLPFRGQLKMAQTCQKFKKKTNKDSKFRLKLYRKRLFINKNL